MARRTGIPAADKEPTIDELLDLLGVLEHRLSKTLNAGFDSKPTFDQLKAMASRYLNLSKYFLELASKAHSIVVLMADREDAARARAKKRARRSPRRGS
jgi:hypothetical protein